MKRTRSASQIKYCPRRLIVAVFLMAAFVAGCAGNGNQGERSNPGHDAGSGGTTGADGSTPSDCRLAKPVDLVAKVQRRLPHARSSYVQGLLVDNGVLYESSGLYGESRLRALDPDTGALLSEVRLPRDVFGEGLAIGRSGELVQLTWKEGVAYRWPRDQVREGGRPSGVFHYRGEGWGLTTLAGGALLMSDGSDRLVERDPASFRVRQTHHVTRLGGSADELNELEFDGRWVWANRYQSTEILRIDPHCWTVTGVVDASSLRDEVARGAATRDEPIDVLNGIAWIPGTDQFLVTGKWWPTLFQVSFVKRR